MIRIIFLVYLVSLSTFLTAQDQLIYNNGQKEYVDSILKLENDTLFYQNFKKAYKVSLSDVKGYYITIKSKENLEKGFSKREKEYFKVGDSIRLEKKDRTYTTKYRQYIVKTTIPFITKGIYDINVTYEKFLKKKTSFVSNLNIGIVNDFDVFFNNYGFSSSTLENTNYNTDGFSLGYMAGYRFYFVPYRKFRPGGFYIGLAAQPIYTKTYCDVKFSSNDIVLLHYREETQNIGVNLGATAGVQWLIAGRVCLDFELKVFGSISKFSNEQTVYINDGFEPNDVFTKNTVPIIFNLNFGYAFD